MKSFKKIERLVKRYGLLVVLYAAVHYRDDIEEANKTNDTITDMLSKVGYTKPVPDFGRDMVEWIKYVIPDIEELIENPVIGHLTNAMYCAGIDFHSAQQLKVFFSEFVASNQTESEQK